VTIVVSAGRGGNPLTWRESHPVRRNVLLLLAPDIQEAILFLPRTDGRRAPIRECHIRPICAIPDRRKQRRMWGDLVGPRDSATGHPAR